MERAHTLIQQYFIRLLRELVQEGEYSALLTAATGMSQRRFVDLQVTYRFLGPGAFVPIHIHFRYRRTCHMNILILRECQHSFFNCYISTERK
jgi:hypothetical protein